MGHLVDASEIPEKTNTLVNWIFVEETRTKPPKKFLVGDSLVLYGQLW